LVFLQNFRIFSHNKGKKARHLGKNGNILRSSFVIHFFCDLIREIDPDILTGCRIIEAET
jgi:hypothetical protein